MKNILTFLTLSAFLIAASCNKDNTEPIDTAQIKLSFKATYGGEPLVLNKKTYEYRGNLVRFSKINFYLSDLVVTNDDGDTELTEIQYIDLTPSHSTEEGAQEGVTMDFSKVPIGNYKKLKFGIGVPADLNRTTPSDYSTSHPLGADNSGEYWEAWNSYIFAKIEGQYDRNGDGTINGEDISFAYHTGMDRVYRPIELDNQLALKAGETTTLNFELDIKELMSQRKGELIELEPHDPNNQIAEMIQIMENFRTALQLSK